MSADRNYSTLLLDNAIRELREARDHVRHEKLEKAETDIGKALKYMGKALVEIQKIEKGRG